MAAAPAAAEVVATTRPTSGRIYGVPAAVIHDRDGIGRRWTDDERTDEQRTQESVRPPARPLTRPLEPALNEQLLRAERVAVAAGRRLVDDPFIAFVRLVAGQYHVELDRLLVSPATVAVGTPPPPDSVAEQWALDNAFGTPLKPARGALRAQDLDDTAAAMDRQKLPTGVAVQVLEQLERPWMRRWQQQGEAVPSAELARGIDLALTRLELEYPARFADATLEDFLHDRLARTLFAQAVGAVMQQDAYHHGARRVFQRSLSALHHALADAVRRLGTTFRRRRGGGGVERHLGTRDAPTPYSHRRGVFAPYYTATSVPPVHAPTGHGVHLY